MSRHLLSIALSLAALSLMAAPPKATALEAQRPEINRWRVSQIRFTFHVPGQGLHVETIPGSQAEAVALNPRAVGMILGPWIDGQIEHPVRLQTQDGPTVTGAQVLQRYAASGARLAVLHRDNRVTLLPAADKVGAELTGVTVDLVHPTTRMRREHTYAPRQLEGLFWSDRAVLDILAPFYGREGAGKVTPLGLLRPRSSQPDLPVSITPEVVGRIWSGTLGLGLPSGVEGMDSGPKDLGPGIIIKDLDCNQWDEPQP